MANNNSLIQFKRGTLAALQNMMDATNHPTDNAKIEDGCFYLTVDTGIESSRLFVGKVEGNTKKVVPVNQGIIRVPDITTLKTMDNQSKFQEGDFAYVVSGNILAVYSNNKWVQINASAEDDEHINSISLEVTTANGVATISTIGHLLQSGTDLHDEFTITGANGVVVSSSNEDITITGDTYTMSAAATSGATTGDSVDLKLDSTNTNNDSKVVFKGKRTNAAGNVTVEYDNTGSTNSIILDARDTTNSSLAIESDSTKVTPGWDITVTDSQTHPVTDTLDPVIKIGENARSVKFYGNEAVLDVYTIAETKELLRALDGLKYCGTIGTATGSTYPSLGGITTDIHVGDMYKATSTLSYGSPAQEIAKAGDILIARGTEDTDPTHTVAPNNTYGTIISGLTWDVIPSGDDAVQHHLKVSTSGTGIELVDPNNLTTGKFELTAGTGISLGDTTISSGITSPGEGTTVTINHATTQGYNGTATAATAVTQSANTAAADATSITYIKDISRDSFGHVATVTTQTFTPTDTNLRFAATDDFVTTVTDVAANPNREVNVGTEINFIDGKGSSVSADTSFNIASQNLDVYTSSGKAMINFYWGTF